MVRRPSLIVAFVLLAVSSASYAAAQNNAAPRPLTAHQQLARDIYKELVEINTTTERDGYFYGRGTADDKAMAAIFVANLIRMKQEGYVPERDLIVALTADEEGGDHNGVEWLLNNKRETIDAAYALNEGGGGFLKGGKPFVHNVQAAEKVYYDFTFEVRNKGGHSSRPLKDNAIYRLSNALGRLEGHAFPVMLSPVTKAYFERLAATESGQVAADMRAVAANPNDAAAVGRLTTSPTYNAMLRTTCVATRLEGGHANNALPQLARATVNCRVLPEHDVKDVHATLVRLAGDTAVHVSAVPEARGGPSSPLTDEVLRPIERLTNEMWPGIPVIPVMSTGATDARPLRLNGIPTYGVSGLFGDMDDSRAHGRDERMLVKSFFEGQEFLYRLVKELATRRPVS